MSNRITSHVDGHPDVGDPRWKQGVVEQLRKIVRTMGLMEDDLEALGGPDPISEFPRLLPGGTGELPIGSQIVWATDDQDDINGDWLMCDGQAVSRTTYSDLFDLVGTTYGAGNGTTTFNLPDYRGRSFIGVNNANTPNGANGGLTTRNLNAEVGAESIALTESQMPVHTHGVTDPGHTHTGKRANGIAAGGDPDSYTPVTNNYTAGALVLSGTTGISINNAGSGANHPNVHPVKCGGIPVIRALMSNSTAASQGVAYGSMLGSISMASGSFADSLDQSTFTYSETGKANRTYDTVKLPVGVTGVGHTLELRKRIPEGFSGWRTVGVRAFMAADGWGDVASSKLDLFLKVLKADGTVVATKTVTYTADEDPTSLTKFEIQGADLAGSFLAGDVLVVQMGVPDTGNTGDSDAAWDHHFSALEVNWK